MGRWTKFKLFLREGSVIFFKWLINFNKRWIIWDNLNPILEGTILNQILLITRSNSILPKSFIYKTSFLICFIFDLVIAKQSYFPQVSNDHKFGGLHQTNVENFSSHPPCSFFTPQHAKKNLENTFLSFGKIYTKKNSENVDSILSRYFLSNSS
jgi:hypothetical protein